MTCHTDDVPKSMSTYLPDDLEERYAALKATIANHDLPQAERLEALRTLQAWHRRWRELTESHRLTWQERRFLRKLNDGEPLTPYGGSEGNLRIIEREQAERARRQRLIRLYGKDGARAIETLADRLMIARPRVPEHRALEWAETKFQRGEHLTYDV